MKRTWLVNFNEELCNHVQAIAELGFVSWKMRRNAKIQIGDVVYVVKSHCTPEQDAIRYKMTVTKVREPRQDLEYWVKRWRKKVAADTTLRLKPLQAYDFDERKTVTALIEQGGFLGLQAIQSPKCLDNDPTLKAYIESVCE